MDFLSKLNCPQYVNFESDFIKNNDSLADAESSSYSSIKDDMESESLDIENENANSHYSQNNELHAGSMQSTLSESYLADSSCQESTGSHESVYLNEEFPVHRPKNEFETAKDFKKDLKNNKMTKVRPFHLTESKKRKREDEHIPLAEQVVAFQKKTPQRFHNTGPKAYEPMKHWSPQIIHPKSPNLQTAKRKRTINVLSREEQEAKEAEEMKGYRFRAQPVKHHILQSPHLPKMGKKLPTKPKSLQLRTAERAAETLAKKKEDEKPYEFHARPVPQSVFSGPTGLKGKQILPSTEPKTPNFALRRREEKWKSEKLNASVQEAQTFKALPAPASTLPFAVKHEKKRTEIQPFSFDITDKERMTQKEQKIMEEIEKENRVYVFKAQPMPSPRPSALPAVLKKSATHPQPFSFHSEGRSFKHSSFNSSIDQMCPTFKAQPATVLVKPPFIPEKPPKQPVEIKEFQLHTDIRASERLKLKEINDIKEHEKELALQRLRELQEEEERKKILKLRKEIVHKANPVRNYKPVEIKPSSKPLTQPMSPKFKTEERLQLKH